MKWTREMPPSSASQNPSTCHRPSPPTTSERPNVERMTVSVNGVNA